MSLEIPIIKRLLACTTEPEISDRIYFRKTVADISVLIYALVVLSLSSVVVKYM